MRFLIISTTRTGTMMLTSMLNSHPDLQCHGEESWTFCQELGARQGANLKYTEAEVLSPQERHVRCIVLPQDDLSSFRIIHLVRRNLLELAISKVMNANKARYRRPAHVYDHPAIEHLGHIDSQAGRDTPRIRKILAELPISTREHLQAISGQRHPMDPNEVAAAMRLTSAQVTRWLHLFRERALGEQARQLLTVLYEQIAPEGDLREMPAEPAQAICDFLGVRPAKMHASMAKVNDPDYARYIENWDQLQDLELPLRESYARAISAAVGEPVSR